MNAKERDRVEQGMREYQDKAILSALAASSDLEEESLKEKVLSEYGKGNIVLSTSEGLVVVRLDEFIKQPTKYMLFDLILDEETILTNIVQPKGTNDFAAGKVIIKLKERIEELESRIRLLILEEYKKAKKITDAYEDEQRTYL